VQFDEAEAQETAEQGHARLTWVTRLIQPTVERSFSGHRTQRCLADAGGLYKTVNCLVGIVLK
jgi:hypothetical protein